MFTRKIVAFVLSSALAFGVATWAPAAVSKDYSFKVYADQTANTGLPSYAVEMAQRVNEQRNGAGVASLGLSPELCAVAQQRAQELVTSFSHTRPDGRSGVTALSDNGIGYRYYGENIAYGYNSVSSALNGWLNSTGHRANIFSGNYQYLGVGMVQQNGTCYWVQIFLTGSGVTSVDLNNAGTSSEGAQAFVNRLYTVALGRNQDPEGASYWLSRLGTGSVTGADVARGFLYSQEFLGKNISNEEFVETLYRTFFNRASDPQGKAQWVSQLNNGAGRQSVIEGFINSVEWYQLCNSYGIPSGSAAAPR